MKMKVTRKKFSLAALAFVIALIVLPTGTPEDLFTSVPLLLFVGWKVFLILCAIALIALLLVKNKKRRN